MTTACLSVLIECAGAGVRGRAIESLLFGVAATDPLTFAVVATLLVTVAAVPAGCPLATPRTSAREQQPEAGSGGRWHHGIEQRHQPDVLVPVALGIDRFSKGMRGRLKMTRALRELDQVLEHVGAYRVEAWTLADSAPELVAGAWVTPGLLQTLGVAPVLGRSLEAAGGGADALISERLRQARFGEREDLLGPPLRLQHGAFTVVGVLGQDFRFPTVATDVWRGVDLSTR